MLISMPIFANCGVGIYWRTDAQTCPAVNHAIFQLNAAVNKQGTPVDQITDATWLALMKAFVKTPAYHQLVLHEKSTGECADPLVIKWIQAFLQHPIDGKNTYKFATFQSHGADDDIAYMTNGVDIIALADKYANMQSAADLNKAIYWYQFSTQTDGCWYITQLAPISIAKTYAKMGKNNLAFCQILDNDDTSLNMLMLAQFYVGNAVQNADVMEALGGDGWAVGDGGLAALPVPGTLQANIQAYALAFASQVALTAELVNSKIAGIDAEDKKPQQQYADTLIANTVTRLNQLDKTGTALKKAQALSKYYSQQWQDHHRNPKAYKAKNCSETIKKFN